MRAKAYRMRKGSILQRIGDVMRILQRHSRFAAHLAVVATVGFYAGNAARAAEPQIDPSKVELLVRLELAQPKDALVIVQDTKSKDSLCGWVAENRKNRSKESLYFRLFFYSTSKDGKPLIVFYDPLIENILQISGFMVPELCYRSGYIPSPMPINKYAEMFNQMVLNDKRTNVGQVNP